MTGTTAALRAVGISGSPSSGSKSRALVAYALERLADCGAETAMIDLAALPAEGLLGRRAEARVTAALVAVAGARVVVAGTPIYRATYSGLLKVLFDLLPQDGLAGKIGIAIATGHGPAHSLAIDHGLRPLFASLGATVVPSGVYGSSEQFANGQVAPELLGAVDRAVREAVAFAAAAID